MVKDIKNNASFWAITTLILFSIVVFFNNRRLKNVEININKHLKKTVAYTIGCTKNIRSSMHDVDYKFEYNNHFYFGSEKFNKSKQGDICRGYRFIVEFDSTNPKNNRILLDSMITTNPLYDDRFK